MQIWYLFERGRKIGNDMIERLDITAKKCCQFCLLNQKVKWPNDFRLILNLLNIFYNHK